MAIFYVDCKNLLSFEAWQHETLSSESILFLHPYLENGITIYGI